MKVALSGGAVLAMAGVAVLGLGAWWLYGKRGAVSAAASAAVQAVNPASPDNLINRGVSSIGEGITGQAGWSLGGQLAEWFSPSVRAANESLQPVRVIPGQAYDETERLARRYPSMPVREILTYELPSSQVAPYFAP